MYHSLLNPFYRILGTNLSLLDNWHPTSILRQQARRTSSFLIKGARRFWFIPQNSTAQQDFPLQQKCSPSMLSKMAAMSVCGYWYMWPMQLEELKFSLI